MTRARAWVRLTCLSLMLATPTAAGGPESTASAFHADIEKLLQVTGTEKAGGEMASSTTDFMVERLRNVRPDMPEDAYTVARQVLSEEFARAYAAPDGLGARLTAIYARHFTHDEIKGLLTFYESDLGRKTIQLMPSLIQESAAAGQDWMRTQLPHISMTLDRRLREEGFLK